MMQVPMADPFDGYFDVVVIRKISLLKVIANIRRLFSGKHIRMREVSVFSTRELTISAIPCVRGEVEGEMLALGDYEISMFAKKINVLLIK
jgi:diacylglycerol kinase (ATP)